MKNIRIFSSGKITGIGIVLVTSMILVFLLISFSTEMALIYLLMLVTYYFWLKQDKDITLPVERTEKGRFMSVIYAAAIFVAFLLIASFVGKGGINSVIQILGTTTPIFAGNQILTFVSWGILIPIIETVLFFGIFYEGIAYYAGKFMKVGPIPTRLTNNPLLTYLIGVIIAIAFIFTAYHFQTRGLTDTVGLIITFIFAVVSCITVSLFSQTREGILVHIYTNSVAVVSAMSTAAISATGA